MTNETTTVSIDLLRRRLLLGVGGGVIAAALPAHVFAGPVETATPEAFRALSRFLTERTTLPQGFTDALWSAFTRLDAGFAAKVTQLWSLVETQGIAASDLQSRLKAAPDAADLAGLPALILTGWYLGVAGSGEQANCVAYVDALANQGVADVLHPPSYAAGAYGSWANSPV